AHLRGSIRIIIYYSCPFTSPFWLGQRACRPPLLKLRQSLGQNDVPGPAAKAGRGVDGLQFTLFDPGEYFPAADAEETSQLANREAGRREGISHAPPLVGADLRHAPGPARCGAAPAATVAPLRGWRGGCGSAPATGRGAWTRGQGES